MIRRCLFKSEREVEKITMKKTIALVIALVLMLSLGVASASIYGGVEDRAALTEANKGAHQANGDQGGKFTLKLNKTQEVYEAAGFKTDADYLSLESVGGSIFTGHIYISNS